MFHFSFSSFKGREMGNEKLIAILDLQQIAYKNVDPRGLITGFQFLQVSLFLFLPFYKDIYPDKVGVFTFSNTTMHSHPKKMCLGMYACPIYWGWGWGSIPTKLCAEQKFKGNATPLY